MGFRIPKHLRDSLYRRFNRTEFDESVLLNANPPPRAPSYLEAAISAYGLSIRARQQPLIKEIDMFDKKFFATPVFNKLESDPNFSVVKKIDVDEKIFELIATQNLRAIHVDGDIENNLSAGSMLIISCHDAAFVAYISGFCESTLDRYKTLLEFKLAYQPQTTATV